MNVLTLGRFESIGSCKELVRQSPTSVVADEVATCAWVTLPHLALRELPGLAACPWKCDLIHGAITQGFRR